jgi:Xaa-Pro aminopeptidase
VEAGYGDEFGHSLGHGVGLEVHEAPWVASRVETKLEDGMTFTIEPGIYISGWGGVRIEDVVVLENGKARVLSHAPKLET